MNKKLLVAAITGVVLAGAAQAQSNVTLYGIVDAGVQSANSPNGNVGRLQSGLQNGSRWGLRGTEDLGDGLKANFNLESGFTTDTGASAQGGLLFGRRATVGLQGGFGSVQLGRRDSPLADTLYAVDPNGVGSALGFNDILTQAGRGYTRRINNQIRYETPDFSGFKAQALYAFGESNTVSGTAKSVNDVVGLSASYANGPLYLGYAYQSSKDPAVTTLGVTTGTTSNKFNTIAGSYDLSVVKFSGFYLTNKKDVAPLVPVPTDQRIYSLGASVPFGANLIAVQYGKVKDKVSTLYRPTGPADARMWGVNYQYSLSKRTNLYAGYTNIRNDNFTSAVGGFTAYSDGLFDTTSNSTLSNHISAKSDAWIVGVRHMF